MYNVKKERSGSKQGCVCLDACWLLVLSQNHHLVSFSRPR